VVLRQFTNMIDAHVWVQRLLSLPSSGTASLMGDQDSPREGDVLIAREGMPRLDPHSLLSPQWRYRVTVFGRPKEAHTFTSFPHAASAAEQLASTHEVRVIYVEDGRHTVLADYR
jgi:hypothetical protein